MLISGILRSLSRAAALLAALSWQPAAAQDAPPPAPGRSGLACANTRLGDFVIYDNGRVVRQDHNAARQYWVGHNFIVFQDYMNSLRVYYDGHAQEVATGIDQVEMSDSMFLWDFAGTLRAWKQGKEHLICYNTSFYKLNENTVVYYDDRAMAISIWYDGHSYPLDQNMIEFPFTTLSVGCRTAAWQTSENEFKLYVGGEILSRTFADAGIGYVAGAGFCALRNIENNQLELLRREGMFVLATSLPARWRASYGRLLYENVHGDFIIVERDAATPLSPAAPEIMEPTANGLFYSRSGHVYYYERGLEREVTDRLPDAPHCFGRAMVYRDELGRTWVWDDGRAQLVDAPPGVEIAPMNDVLVLTDARRTAFWHRGKTYPAD